MRLRVRVFLVLVLTMTAALMLTSLAGAQGTGVRLTTTLTGAGDPDGTGFAVLRLNPGLETVCYTIVVEDIAAPTEPAPGLGSAHVHEAPAGSSGPIAIDLDATFTETSPGVFRAAGCVTADRKDILDVILNPENYYVNVHNADFPAGAVRGQLG